MVMSAFLITVSMVLGQVNQPVQLSKELVELNPDKSVTYTVPAIDGGDKRVTLSFYARGKGDYDSGYTHGLQIYINGKVVQAAEDRRMVRLLNKPLEFPYKKWKGITYKRSRYYTRGTGWVIIWAPSYEPSDKKPWLLDKWASYVLAVEDLLHSEKPNTIEFRNEHPRHKAVVMLDKVQLTRTDQAGFGQMKPTPAFPDHPPRRTDFASLKNPDLQVDSTGGLVIQHDGRKYNFETIFSLW